MTLAALVLLVLLITTDALKSLNEECEDCNENGPWWPLFKPSQIINSEFPEHRRQFKSEEASGSYEHQGSHGPQPSREREEDQYRVNWDHYEDVSKVSTLPNNSVEGHYSSAELYRSGEEVVDSRLKKVSTSAEYPSVKSADSSFGSFLDRGSFSPMKSRLSDDFLSKEFSFSNEESNSIEFPGFNNAFGRQNKQVATSYAAFSSVFAKPRPVVPQARDLLHPVSADSYHPHYANYGQERRPVGHLKYVNANGINVTVPYLAQEQDRVDPGVGLMRNNPYNPLVLWVSPKHPNKPIARSSQHSVNPLQNNRGPFVPLDHPVYRYVKHHAGHAVQRLQPTPTSSRRHQDVLRDYGGNVSLQTQTHPNSPVQVHIQNHETVVRHVVPTKRPSSDNFWKESRRIETLQPPPVSQPLTHSLYIIKKKPNIGLRRIGRRAPTHVYILKDKKSLS